ncbi:MAG: TIGR01777 family oxidoreductase [bacterium]
MKIVVSGSTGLIGRAIVADLSSQGHDVIPLVRSGDSPTGKQVRWDPDGGMINRDGLKGIDAVVHLAGENIASGRWTTSKKARIRDSRIIGTRLLSEALARLKPPPAVLLSASACGFYGDRGDDEVDENDGPGNGFLADLCREWEAATKPATEAGIRVVHLRFGVILSADGGALAKMLPSFRFGLGGRLGSGRQYMSWISLEDIVAAIYHCLNTGSLRGAVNLVSPNAVTNREFTQALGKVLCRPTMMTVPAGVLRFLFGEMAREMLLTSTRVKPTRLVESGFRFRRPHLEIILRHELKRT